MSKLGLEVLKLLLPIVVKQPVEGLLIIWSEEIMVSISKIRKRNMNLLLTGQLQRQIMLAEHVPHGTQLSKELRIKL